LAYQTNKTMADKLPKEIQQYHKQQAKIADLYVKLSKLGEAIVSQYCPYKKGDKIVFDFYNIRKHGIIDQIRFKGVDASAVDKKWILRVAPTKKDFNPDARTSAWDFIGGDGHFNYIKIISINGKEV
jgi:hypothetical protein